MAKQDEWIDVNNVKNSAQLLKEQQQHYNQTYVPVEDEAIAELKSTALIDNARSDMDRAFNQQGDRTTRDARRYGVTGQTALQRSVADKQLGLRQATNRVDVMNNAYADQYVRNQGLRDTLVGIGGDIETDATQGFLNASANKQSVYNANKAASASDSAQKMQTGIAVASLLAMMM